MAHMGLFSIFAVRIDCEHQVKEQMKKQLEDGRGMGRAWAVLGELYDVEVLRSRSSLRRFRML